MTTASAQTFAPRLLQRALHLRMARVLLAAAAIAAVPAPAFAQDSVAETRLRKIEAEVRALQRKVFPGGDARLFEPQIGASSQAPANPAQPTIGVIPPANTPVTDILVRLDALEAQLQVLTARSEEQANQLAQLELRLAALEGGQVAAVDPAPVAIAKPQTADAGDDEYSYGFRLWSGGFFPEARQQLTKFVEQYPNHARISFGRNLLGRAFLDDKMPEEAARWFLKNYQANKNGERAPDSLLYLGASMIAMKDTKRACIALAEFAETYPLLAAGRLANDYQANRAKVTCS
jgi:TolA-binding protein